MSARGFKAYPAYKDTEVNWVGQIPAHWDVRRLKYLAVLNPDSLAEDTDPTQEIVYVDIGGVDSLGRITERERLAFASAPSRARRLVRDGDIIVSTVRTYLRAIAAIRDPEPELVVSTGFAIVRPKERLIAEYAAYTLRAPYFVERVVANSKGVSFPAINETEMATFELPVPSEGEQRAIAAFLDIETAQIDALVAKKEQLLELLEEKRDALITRAVTKGLDSGAPMRDSGIEWLGEIPAHWETRRIRDIAESLQTGPFGSQLHADEYVFGQLPVINPANLHNGQLVADQSCTIDGNVAARLEHHQVQANDLLFARRGELGRSGLVTEAQTGWLCGTGCLRLRTRPESVNSKFLLLLLSTSGLRDWLELQSVGSTMQNVNTSIIGRIPIAIPALAEQQVIVTFVERETTAIASLIAAIRVAIDRLEEFRSATISAAVTGKIDVRDHVSASADAVTSV